MQPTTNMKGNQGTKPSFVPRWGTFNPNAPSSSPVRLLLLLASPRPLSLAWSLPSTLHTGWPSFDATMKPKVQRNFIYGQRREKNGTLSVCCQTLRTFINGSYLFCLYRSNKSCRGKGLLPEHKNVENSPLTGHPDWKKWQSTW